jgi:GntR family transcriptional regulator, transcriptional repressor for pyruvate dehydrogenase complex
VAAPLTESAIEKLRDMIASGALRPGDRLPPEPQLASQLGASRNTAREAVRALVTARVLDVRRGHGTYVTSLRPELLLDGISFAAELLQADFALELIGVRRILEGAATRMAAQHMDERLRDELQHCLDRMHSARSHDVVVRYDARFHAIIAGASGNATLASMLSGVSGQTMRARVWRGNLDASVVSRTLRQHEDILAALVAGDGALAEATAVLHVATTEAWIREIVARGDGSRAWASSRRPPEDRPDFVPSSYPGDGDARDGPDDDGATPRR